MAVRRAASVLAATLVGAVVMAVPAQAATVTQTIGGVTYQVDDANVAAGAMVTGGTAVPAALVIPSTVDIGGNTYDVVEVGGHALESKGLTSVVIPSTVTRLDPYSFAHNSLTSVTVPGSVGLINTAAFAFNSLTSVTLSEGIRVIEGGAFYTNNLTDVVIPSTVYDISGNAFDLSPALATVTFQGNAPALDYSRPLGASTTIARYYAGATGFTTPTWNGGSSTSYTTQVIPLVTATFDANGHGTAPAGTTTRSPGSVADPGDLSATGYTFTGWWTAASGGTRVTFPYSFTSDVTLYAQWAALPATIDAPAQANQGDTITVTGANFASAETIELWLLSTPVRLATITADANGAFATTITIPANTPAGAHTIEARGTSTATVSRAVTVSAVLASTGADASDTLWLALALLGTGTALTLARRRVRR